MSRRRHRRSGRRWPALSGGISAAAIAGFLGGQSNSGNQDDTPGTIDARVSLTWGSMYSGTVDGPGPMRMQTAGVATGHSFEWQCASDLAAYFDGNVIAGKYWADGTIISDFLPPNTKWLGLAAVLHRIALQCVAARVSRVEFGWCQGETNTANAMSAYIAAFESDTNTLFDAVKALLAGHGLGVHFSVLKTNARLSVLVGPNPGDVNAGYLATVRAAQENLSVTRDDTTTVSLDAVVPVLNLHYAFGETNLCGTIWADSIKARY